MITNFQIYLNHLKPINEKLWISFSLEMFIYSDNRLAKKVTKKIKILHCDAYQSFHLKYGSFRPGHFFVNYSCFSQHINSMHHAIFITMRMTLNCFCSILRKITSFFPPSIFIHENHISITFYFQYEFIWYFRRCRWLKAYSV